MLGNSVAVAVVVVRTRPRAIPLAMITMRKSAHGFPFLSSMSRLSHKLLGNFSATFEIFGNFLEFWQLLEFSATLGFLRFFEATFFTF